jgi:hypothetical protein
MSHSHSLDHILHRPEIVQLVFSTLSPANALKFSRVRQVTRDVMTIVNATTYCINRHLHHFFSDLLGFRSLQAWTGTLISGSNALQFLDRTHYPESDLDIYTHPGHALEVGLWLINKGYTYQPVTADETQIFTDIEFDTWMPWTTHWNDTEFIADLNIELDYAVPGISDVYHFVKVRAGQRREIQIMAAINTPMQCILGFHSSTSLKP